VGGWVYWKDQQDVETQNKEQYYWCFVPWIFILYSVTCGKSVLRTGPHRGMRFSKDLANMIAAIFSVYKSGT
jgi:hypothetical protein